jgi:hypothetical protein
MLVLNKIIKGIFYLALIAFMVTQSYAIGLFFSGAVLSIITAVWSIIKPLPAVFTDKMWLIYLLAGIPAGLVVFIIVAVNSFSSSKKNKK